MTDYKVYSILELMLALEAFATELENDTGDGSFITKPELADILAGLQEHDQP